MNTGADAADQIVRMTLNGVDAEKNLCNRVPSLPELEKMIAQAKELEPVITY